MDTGERERKEVTQSEVRDPAPSPTAYIMSDAMLHEPARFDWAAEVDKAHGLSPIAPSNSTTPIPAPIPVNPVPSDVTVDPVRITFANPEPTDSDPADPNAVVCVDPIRITPSQLMHADPVACKVANEPVRVTPASAVRSEPIPVDPASTSSVDATANPINPIRIALANTAPTNIIPVDPDPGDMAPNPDGVLLASIRILGERLKCC